jgi:uncharacterized protein YbaP (TraB family)
VGAWLMLAGCAASSVGSSPDAEPGAGPFLWRVHDDARPGRMYLLGSVHVRRRDAAPLPPVVWEAFGRADTLVLEADVSSALTLALDVTRLGLLPPGESLGDHVPPELYAKLEAREGELGVDRASLDRMRPWLAALSIAAAQFRSAELHAATGVDHVMAEAARRRGLDRRFLETTREHLGVFADLPEDAQIRLLTAAVADTDPDAMRASLDGLMRAYEAGDDEALAARTHDDMDDAPELRRRLFDDRNAAWVEVLLSMLDEDRTFFVTVGAGHLVGDGSVLERLSARGLSVERLRDLDQLEPRAPLRWVEMHRPRLGLRVELPAAPVETESPPAGGAEVGLELAVFRPEESFAVKGWRWPPAAAPGLAASADAVVEAALLDVATRAGGRLAERAELPVAAGTAAEQRIELPEGELWVRVYVVDARTFELRAACHGPANRAAFRARRERFFASLRIEEEPTP